MGVARPLGGVLLALAAVVSACGSSSQLGPKREEAASSASKICTAANARVERGFRASSDPQVRQGTISQAEVRYPVARSTLDEMRGLSEPETGLRQWRAFVDAQAGAVVAFRRLVGHGSQGAVSLGLARAKSAEAALLAAGDRTKLTAARLGATACERGPYQQTLQGVAVKDQPPELGAGTAHATLRGYGFAFAYPANWHRQRVTDATRDEQVVAYGSAESGCIAGHDTTIYHGPQTAGPKLLSYLKGQVAVGKKEAGSYKLYRIGVARADGGYLQGGVIVRRSVKGSDVRNGRIVFLFDRGRRAPRSRYLIDCETSDTKHFDTIDRTVFQPFVDSFDVSPPKPG